MYESLQLSIITMSREVFQANQMIFIHRKSLLRFTSQGLWHNLMVKWVIKRQVISFQHSFILRLCSFCIHPLWVEFETQCVKAEFEDEKRLFKNIFRRLLLNKKYLLLQALLFTGGPNFAIRNYYYFIPNAKEKIPKSTCLTSHHFKLQKKG